MATEGVKVQVTVELSPSTVEMLSVLRHPGEAPMSVESVLATLADHADQGVYRPGAWERGWLAQVFGDEWVGDLEQDPEASWRQRPRRKAVR